MNGTEGGGEITPKKINAPSHHRILGSLGIQRLDIYNLINPPPPTSFSMGSGRPMFPIPLKAADLFLNAT